MELTEKDVENPDILGEKLIQLAEIVIRKHFYASYDEKDDLVSVGVLKALNLIHENKWTRSKGNFMTYIYTGMRNDIHNYLYHQNKFSIADTDNLREDGRDDLYFEDECNIDFSLIHSVCMHFTKKFGEGIEDEVIEKIEEMGYKIQGRVNNKLRYCKSIIQEDYGKDIDEDIVGRIIGLILWKKKEREK